MMRSRLDSSLSGKGGLVCEEHVKVAYFYVPVQLHRVSKSVQDGL
jgi:hypothetical protein